MVRNYEGEAKMTEQKLNLFGLLFCFSLWQLDKILKVAPCSTPAFRRPRYARRADVPAPDLNRAIRV